MTGQKSFGGAPLAFRASGPEVHPSVQPDLGIERLPRKADYASLIPNEAGGRGASPSIHAGRSQLIDLSSVEIRVEEQNR